MRQSKRAKNAPREFWQANPEVAAAATAAAADDGDDEELQEVMARSKKDVGRTPPAAPTSGRTRNGRASKTGGPNLAQWNQDMEKILADRDDDRLVSRLREVVLKAEPCSSCGAAFHSKGKQNCAVNPECIWGLGEHRAGIWAKRPQSLEAVPKPDSVKRKALADGHQHPVGLYNFGATCYVNSILQILFMNPQFQAGLLSTEWWNWSSDGQRVVCAQLRQTFAHLKQGKTASFYPTDFIKVARLDSSYQQDVSEFLKMMLSKIEKELVGTPRCKLVQETFQGSCKNVTECSTCAHRSDRSQQLQPFYELQLFPSAGEPWLTAAIPMDNPHCSCKLTRVRPPLQKRT